MLGAILPSFALRKHESVYRQWEPPTERYCKPTCGQGPKGPPTSGMRLHGLFPPVPVPAIHPALGFKSHYPSEVLLSWSAPASQQAQMAITCLSANRASSQIRFLDGFWERKVRIHRTAGTWGELKGFCLSPSPPGKPNGLHQSRWDRAHVSPANPSFPKSSLQITSRGRRFHFHHLLHDSFVFYRILEPLWVTVLPSYWQSH